MAVFYEWDVETVDEHDDIVDHNHSQTVADIAVELNSPGTRLVLVRDTVVENEGIVDRRWAYVENGVLPEFFDDSRIKVPKRFHEELAAENISVMEG